MKASDLKLRLRLTDEGKVGRKWSVCYSRNERNQHMMRQDRKGDQVSADRRSQPADRSPQISDLRSGNRDALEDLGDDILWADIFGFCLVG